MAKLLANGMELEYESFGNENDPAILLIMGLGQQLIQWPDSMCQLLVQQGYRVLRFDNRDCGLSTHLDALGTPDIRKVILRKTFGLRPKVPYSLLDMATDSAELLRELDIEAAHIVGASMGGMIAQLLASHYPDRALSLTSIMSTTGNRRVAKPSRRAARAIFSPHGAPGDIEKIIERSLMLCRVFAGSGYPLDEELTRQKIEAATLRAYNPSGTLRQLAASLASGDRRRQLRKLNIPVTVIHGEDDPLIPLACGIDTVKNVPNADLVVVPKMGHEFPEAAMPIFANAIDQVARRVS